MKQIWLLTKIQLGSTFTLFKRNKNKVKKRKTSVIIGFFLLFAAFLLICSFMYSYMIGLSLNTMGLLDLLPEMIMAVTCIVTLMTTIYKVKGTLFGFKDYDLTMSLPVKTRSIVISRLLLLYLVNISFTLIIILPASIAYGILMQPSILFYIYSLLTVLLVPLFPMIIATIIGTVITVAAARFRHSNIINILITLALLSAYMVLSFQAGNSKVALGEMGAALSKKIDGIYPLAEMYKKAVCEFNFSSLLLFIAISVISFILFSWVVGSQFKKINTFVGTAKVKSNYKMKAIKEESPFISLYKKELRRYFSSSLYVMNTAVGIVMMTIAAIALLVMSPESFASVMEVPELANVMAYFAAALLAICVSMSVTTACSISLEGKNLWILKSLPITVKTIFLSKIAVNLTITIPAIIIDSLIIAIGLKISLIEFFILLIMPIAYALFVSIYGLIVNLKFPNLDWTTEVMVIKQSVATMISIFSGVIFGAIPIILLFVFMGKNALIIDIIVSVILFILSSVMFNYLKVKGEKIFLSL